MAGAAGSGGREAGEQSMPYMAARQTTARTVCCVTKQWWAAMSGPLVTAAQRCEDDRAAAGWGVPNETRE
jgi:hypothetical protein